MISRRILGRAALVLCTAAIAAPAAQATFRDYGAGGTGGGAGAAPPREPAEHGRGVAQQDTGPVVIDRRPIVLESGGFDWADAGIGAAGAAGLVLVGSGAVLLARRGRREQIATS
jgi:hypothetical protein